jgi:hypothetical protein
MANAAKPEDPSADERLAEIAEILAAGLMRPRARKSSQLSERCFESSLDCTGIQRDHAEAVVRTAP